MLTQSLSIPVPGTTVSHAPLPASDAFATITGHAGLIATEFSYRKDEEIYGEDEPAEYVYQVISGSVRSYKLLSDGRRQIGAFHLPGDVFGLESGTIHRLAAEAIVDTTVRLVKRRSLEQAATVDVNVARKLWAMTAGDLRHAEDHMLLLGRKTAMERVATFLLEMDRRLSVTGMMALPMCRRDIGDYLGLTLETVSRALSQLHGQGVLVFSGARQIVLRNRQRLRTMDA
jgi:CRP/FNR family transcriptional regulator, nitrogen fixation regulation protein